MEENGPCSPLITESGSDFEDVSEYVTIGTAEMLDLLFMDVKPLTSNGKCMTMISRGSSSDIAIIKKYLSLLEDKQALND
jgi:hypothetical protein